MDPQSPSKEYPHPSLSGQPSPAPSVSQNAGINAQIGEIKGQPSLDITAIRAIYLKQFIKPLAAEVRMLLGEIGRIREEKRTLLYEIGELFSMKSKYGPGGEFDPDWKPPGPPPAPTDVPPIPDPTELSVARPAWRSYHPGGKKKKRELKVAPVPAAQRQTGPSQMGPSHMDRDLGRQQATSWSSWHPDPDTVMTPPPAESILMMPDHSSPGLFGPRSPSSPIHDQGSSEPPTIRPAWRPYHLRGKRPKVAPVPTAQPPQVGPSQMGPSPMDRHLRQQVTSWSTWHPDPDTVLTPPPVEPILLVQDRLSPGLFGPRTPSPVDL